MISRFSDAIVLVESTVPDVEGNFPQVTRTIIEKLRFMDIPDGARRTFVDNQRQESSSDSAVHEPFYEGVWGMMNCNFDSPDVNQSNDEYFFHVAKDDGLVYLMLSEEIGKDSRNFSFLEELRSKFTKKFSKYKISRSNAFGMEKTFTREISSLMHFYNTHPNEGLSSEKSAEIMTAKVDDLKSVLGSNIRLMLKRESNIEALMQKTEQMEIEANIFTKNTQLARKKVEKDENKSSSHIKCGLFCFFFFL
eukprot:CAMPEP_0194417394 /NCGR_PEP_ID=MMETSP0176-20130528/16487_1 /TAXON_ID=216777 /ORGANISM="Proboscia alata, Strain PI-D3" /LENGTH=249 /DNA_ID=CAMNT_0039223271 /DNA_START=174 /DNA_END=919 /DNA_ORIENTATION=+